MKKKMGKKTIPQREKKTMSTIISVMCGIVGIIIVMAAGLYVLKSTIGDVNFYNGFCFDKPDGEYTFTPEAMLDISEAYKITNTYQTIQCVDRFAVLKIDTMLE